MADLFEKHNLKPPRTLYIGQQPQTDNSSMPQNAGQSEADMFRKENPFISRVAEIGNKGINKAAEFTSRHPDLSKLIEGSANTLNPINEFMENSSVPEAAGGFIQGLGNMGLSAGNLIAQPFTGKKETAPYLDLRKYLKPENQDSLAFTGGELASNLMPLGAASRFSETMRPSGYMGMLTDILKGAGAGYALGGEGDNRELGALIGGPASYLASNTASKIARRMSNDSRQLHREFGDAYDSLFDAAEDLGSDFVNPIRYNRRALNLGTTRKERGGLIDFLRSPNLRNAHDAQSDMGKIYRDLQRRSRGPSGLNSAERETMEEANNIQNRIRRSIDNTLSESGSPNLAQEYRGITNRYREEMVPYDDFKALTDYMSHRQTPGHARKLMKDINNPENISSLDFLATAGRHYPEAALHQLLSKAGKAAAVTGTAAGTGWAGLRGLSEFRKNR